MENILNLILEILIHIFIIFIAELIIFFGFLKETLVGSLNQTFTNIISSNEKTKDKIKKLFNKDSNNIYLNYVNENSEKIIIDKNNNNILFLIVFIFLLISTSIIIIFLISKIYKINLKIDLVQILSTIGLLITLELILIFQYNLKIIQNKKEELSDFSNLIINYFKQLQIIN